MGRVCGQDMLAGFVGRICWQGMWAGYAGRVCGRISRVKPMISFNGAARGHLRDAD